MVLPIFVAFAARIAELQAGTLVMIVEPSTLRSVTGTSFERQFTDIIAIHMDEVLHFWSATKLTVGFGEES